MRAKRTTCLYCSTPLKQPVHGRRLYCSSTCFKRYRYGGVCKSCGATTNSGTSTWSPDLCSRCTGVAARQDPVPRFWERVEKTDTCWIWQGSTASAGYGVLSVDGKQTYAHRFAYELLVGAIPEDMELDHLCRNAACVNPLHLEPVTHAENIRRGYAAKKAG